MKTIKINFVGFWSNFDQEDFAPYIILKQHFNVVISDTPDYIFCSVFGTPYEYCKYDCIRIFFSSENYSPDFNLFDYAIGFDNIIYDDRYIRNPSGYTRLLQSKYIKQTEEKHVGINQEALKAKEYFCNFIYSHEAHPRDEIYKVIDRYKHIECPGKYQFNMNNGFVADSYDKKIQFQEKCKFSIAVEAESLRGFSTEKIVHAFAAKTVPIYYGDPDIAKSFNERAFVNIHQYGTFEEALQRIIEIDNDDSLYLSMLKEPAVLDNNTLSKLTSDLEQFLLNIFNHDLNAAFRRPREYRPIWHNNRLRDYWLYFDFYQQHLTKNLNRNNADAFEFYQQPEKQDNKTIRIKSFIVRLLPKSIYRKLKR